MTDVRIGVHPSNSTLFVLRRKPELVGDLSVAWLDLDDGRRTIDALAAGEIDFSGTGNTPPIRAQADGVDIVYVAISEPRPAHGALVVASDSPIRGVADLKGKRIALGDGSYQTSLLALALDDAGLSLGDVTRVDVGPRGGKAVFARGEVDAWVAGDPELAQAQREGGVRVLVETSDVISNRSVWFAARRLADERPQVLDAIVAALQRADDWIAANPREAAEIFAREVAGSPGVDHWEAAFRRRPWGPRPVSDEFVAEQQRAADLLARHGFIAREITVADAVLAGVRG